MLLNPYRVLDLTGPLGWFCGKILADLGAEVTKVDLENDTGLQLFRELAKTADFILETFPPGTLSYQQLSAENPGLILVSITPFGQEGPYRDFQASDLEIMALSGAMSLAGEKDGEPMRVTVPQSPGWVGAEAAMGALTALAYRRATGRGQHVDVSAQVAVMAALSHAPAFWDLNRTNPRGAGAFVTGRSIHGAMMRAFWPCQDGWLNFIIYGGSAGRQSNQQLVAWMDENGMAPAWLKEIDWDKFEVTTIAQEEVDRMEAPIGCFFATLTKRQFLEGVVKRGMLGYPVQTVADIYQDSQLAARNFWQDVDGLRYPGGFALINGERLPIREIYEDAGPV